MENWVLITGASSGIGRAATELLASRGYSVFAGVRKLDDAPKGERIVPLELDITNPAQIAAAKAVIVGRVVSSGLKAVVNNAGIGVVGPVEFVTLDEWRKQFEVNFFGQIAVTQAVLPLIRDHVAVAGPGSGRVVLVTSIGGIIGQPIAAAYCASKFALEAVGEALRIELADQGIQVSAIEPGVIKTEIWGKAKTDASKYGPDHPARKLYGKLIETVEAVSKRGAEKGTPPLVVAKAIALCIKAKSPPAHKRVGLDAKMGALAHGTLPAKVFDWGLLKTMKWA